MKQIIIFIHDRVIKGTDFKNGVIRFGQGKSSFCSVSEALVGGDNEKTFDYKQHEQEHKSAQIRGSCKWARE